MCHDITNNIPSSGSFLTLMFPSLFNSLTLIVGPAKKKIKEDPFFHTIW